MGKEYTFRSLTANKEVKIQPVTLQALKYAISDESGITNVAITGNYGAGKSSVIESFENSKAADKKFIHISLAQYDEIDKSEEKNLNNRQINTIEGKIINQLLHQINPNSLRKSIFKTLDAESQIHPLKNAIFLVSIFALLLYILNLASWTKLIDGINILNWTIHPITRLLALAALFALIFYGILFLLKLQRDTGLIKHLTLKSDKVETNIEIFSTDSNKVSYFDRYLDDVIYLFDNCDADIIVFEDIERFNDSRIFEKIKELNIVVNRKRKARKERKESGKTEKLVFFYLVKDNLFESQERTKFFDFIIPIVPVVTASNSYDQLSKILEEMELKAELDEKFLFNISLYLDDMRLINNICNEYQAYTESLRALKLESNKTFSMIVYKNIFPKDFSLLQKNQGYLYELLNSKEKQIAEQKEELTKNIQEINEAIQSARSEHFKDEVELYGLIFQIPKGRTLIKVNGKVQGDFSSYHEFINELRKEDSEIISFTTDDIHYNRSGQKENIKSIFPEEDSKEFQERLQNTKNKRKLSDLSNQCKSLQAELDKLDGLRLSDVYESSNQVEKFSSTYAQSVKANPQFAIIPFLIRNSHIDETYQDYLTYFYDNTLTTNDKEFIVRVISGINGNKKAPLKEIREIVNRLELKNYKYSYVLNYELFKYLLENSEEGKKNAEIKESEEIKKKKEVEENKERLKLIFEQENISGFLNDFYKNLDNKNDKKIIEEVLNPFFNSWLQYNLVSFNQYLESNSDSNSDELNLITSHIYIKSFDDHFSDDPKLLEKLLNKNVLYNATDENEEYLIDLVIDRIPESTITYSIEKFKDLDDDNREKLISDLVYFRKAIVNSEIILAYFSITQTIDEQLIRFINQNPNLTLDRNLFLELDQILQDNFFSQIISKNDLDSTIYHSMITMMNKQIDDFEEAHLSDEKLEILINLEVITFNSTNLEFIRKEYPDLKNYFISKNIENYIEIEEEIHDETELNDLLQYANLNDSYKLQIIDILDSVSLRN